MRKKKPRRVPSKMCKRMSKQEELSPRNNWGEEKKKKEDRAIDTKNQWSRIHRHMIEQLSLTTVQKALTVVNECLLSFSPSSLSFSFTPSVSSQFRATSFSLYLELCPTLFSNTEEGRNPLPREKRSQSDSVFR